MTSTPSSNTLVTTVPTDWNSVSSDIIPNFGDYTPRSWTSELLRVLA